MSDPVRQLDPVESPCIGVCTLGECGLCIGCFRTPEEIGGWLGMSVEARRRVMAELPARADQLFTDD